MALLSGDASLQRRRTVEALVAQMDGAPKGAAEDRIGQALLELGQLVHELRRAAREVAPQLSGPTGALADDIDRALGRRFGEVVGGG